MAFAHTNLVLRRNRCIMRNHVAESGIRIFLLCVFIAVDCPSDGIASHSVGMDIEAFLAGKSHGLLHMLFVPKQRLPGARLVPAGCFQIGLDH